MRDLPINIDLDAVSELCRRYHITKLAFFGSVLRDDFGADSDVDILVEFAEGHTPGLIKLAGIELELTELLGRTVDLRTPKELSNAFREDVLKSAYVQYAA